MKFKNKNELIDFIRKQTNISLKNNKNDINNNKRNLLYTKIDINNKYSILSLLEEYNIKYETHLNDFYWIHIK
ncbi:hypothetical protein ACFHWD_03800 [Clostridium sp. MT-14]|uniref:hypothetical protein n=1 Tax=Clostridium sp. MT-14 TaxID=3348360 RepID=UPI0035F2F15C